MMTCRNTRVLIVIGLLGFSVGCLGGWFGRAVLPGDTSGLPESLTHLPPMERHRALVSGALGLIDRSPADFGRAVAEYPWYRGNQVAALRQIDLYAQGLSVGPMVICAERLRIRDQSFLRVFAVNPRRESRRWLFLVLDEESEAIVLELDIDPEVKESMLVVGLGCVVKEVALADLVQAAVPDPRGTRRVALRYSLRAPLELPIGLPLAVGLEDCCGEISNFVRIEESSVLNMAETGPATSGVKR